MKIMITQSAKEGAWSIFEYHADYDLKFVQSFQGELNRFILKNLNAFPNIGHVYNREKGIYRIIFKARFNIYYIIANETIFIIYILDGQLDLNTKLAKSTAEIPNLE